MKKLTLTNPTYHYLENSFREWLDILGYAPSTTYNIPNLIREYFHYLENQNIRHIRQIDSHHIKSYYTHLKERANQRRGGGLSHSHLNKHIQALRKFTEYLQKAGRQAHTAVPLKNEEAARQITYLTEKEIQHLYQATYLQPAHTKNICPASIAAIQSRDRAMLTIYYGCGLRRSEGVHLDVSDIDLDQQTLHVRKGKNHKQRLVPLGKQAIKYLTEYLYDHRHQLLKGAKSDALFISYKRATRMQGQSLYIRLKYLQYHTQNHTLQQKEIGLHTLRHSIATHLQASGMPLEAISRFLGHSSLESTQIYTHLISEQPYANIPKREIIQLHEVQ